MRKCLRCESDMIEDLDVRVWCSGYGITVNNNKLFSSNLGKISVAVCPKCGYAETYVKDTSKIKNFLDK